ncbi:Cof-type HAD-IIB family hydrolase [Lactococcus formosensis]|jgi:Cof subfamily protein (haloacid dehalogenase superfamily)|uniref:Cof-type HAD-IIB family hydrolase n=2 Tax=Lactococcus formosensis TaxID=1281486 RepID=A0A9Q9D6A4_9LACT|nr:Cof-type HAD-IIB family hydrolase [Lactococcus formosensis]MCH1722497.1 Cof-type HAD-IIB family hydrolase [Lactococcus formosensis]MDG6114292.1 Cof-type HAD-IIB family hydrolase [Lactococcus formosensis]MDG6116445.1 Cof-type HAD-IIB family hydrolase [Lactococcus formosensis]MDG6122586.1 Cof-type HAD-IIB family hydrolase [Lactococcus formosensis]MDG6125047.1 Cof-type HAD-IIB family hydrolase [Lactococcus formosensis]
MITAIATDMDGTFLDEKSTYDKKYFSILQQKMNAKGIRFIVASGNQYFKLKSYFSETKDIIFISENGGIITINGEMEMVASFDAKEVSEVLGLLDELKIPVVVCGAKSAYTLESVSEEFETFAHKYYENLELLSSFDDLPEDTVVKFATIIPEAELTTVTSTLNSRFKKGIKAVTSGNIYLDIVLEGSNKGAAIKKVLQELELSSQDLAAFGDANNDLEMLEMAGYSYAVANANIQAKEKAKRIIGSNREKAVLSEIEKIIQ